MRAAFDLFAGPDGVVDAEELKTTIPLLGEDMTEEQVRCLFINADKDNSGKIEFNEFCDMMYALTPKAGPGGLMDATAALVQGREKLEAAKVAVDGNASDEALIKALGRAFAALVDAEAEMGRFEKSRSDAGKSIQEQAMGVMEGSNEVFDASQVLAPELYGKLYSPEGYTRCGRIVKRMKDYVRPNGKTFTNGDINDVISSLLASSNRDMARAYELWAGEDGKIDAEEFISIVPLLGEDVTKEELECMFASVDEDGNGVIELIEFCKMMHVMQLNRDAFERHILVGHARAQAYAKSVTKK